ncbi:nucleotidyl transferase AbiEii/AbiGii toxin family protein, partial [bacterium]|nr:nucleotidyl transferase AbiEii/AbiGii toxin family protein [bacterium]
LEADSFAVSSHLRRLGESILLKQTQNIHIYLINGIKVDLVNYPYPWIEEINDRDQLRLAGKSDIAAMKLAAITGRGTRKDFIDLYFLLREFDLETMLRFYSEKFYDGSPFLVLKSLTYFEDAEQDPDPFMIGEIEWQSVKERISLAVMEYLKNI